MKKFFIFLLLVVGLASCEKGSVWSNNQKLDQFEVNQDITKMHPVYLKIDSDCWRIYTSDGNIRAKFVPAHPDAVITTVGKLACTHLLMVIAGLLIGYLIVGIGTKPLY